MFHVGDILKAEVSIHLSLEVCESTYLKSACTWTGLGCIEQ